MLSPDPVPIVDVRGLRKTYGRATAVDGLDLTVHAGEIHGFLGPNGAGKSTTLRILLGLIRPTAGSVRVLGRDPWRDPTVTNADIAYVPGDVSLWPNLTGGETIDLLLRLRGGGDAGERERLIQRFALDPRKKARTYSTGNRQKVALIAAFARRAPLYVLDEPTAGLDPLMEAVFRAEVLRVRDAGSTVLLSSHLLSEVEQLCDRVTIIRDGRVVETGELRDLLRRTTTRFEVTGVPAAALAALAGVSEVHEIDGAVAFDAAPDALPAVLEVLHARAATSLSAAPSTLETLFLRHYETDRS
jgi:ABC-2 type transport system ATP-binding protein